VSEFAEFWQTFRTRATRRTPDKTGSPPALRTSPLSLCSTKNELVSTIGSLTSLSSHFLPGGVRGLSQCFGRKRLSGGGALVRLAGHLGSWPPRLSHLSSSSYRLNMTRVESIILLPPNPGRPAKGWVRPAPPWVGWARAFCHIISPCHII
jgi:hypothetical protein